MPIPTKYVYITTPYQGYLAAIKQYGPIVHPAKVTEDEANALFLAGADIIVHDLTTKMNYHMGAKAEMPKVSIPTPIIETVLTGAPKGAGDLGISEQTKVEPKAEINIADVVAEQKSIEDIKETSDATPIEEKQFKLPVESVIEDIQSGAMTEADVNFSDYTKSERRQIRAALSAKASEQTTSTEE